MRTTAAALALCLISLGAAAAAPSPESIERLLKAMDADKMVKGMEQYGESMLKGMTERVVQVRPVKPDQRAKLDATVQQLTATLHEEMSWTNVKAMYVELFSQQFSQEEVDGLIKFYLSPTGRAFLTKMPPVMQKSMTTMQGRLDVLMQKLQGAIKETLEEK